MAVYSIVFSPTGGTEKVAQALTAPWEQVRVIDLTEPGGDYGRYLFEVGDLCFVSVPVFGGRVPQVVLDRLGQMRGNGAMAVAVTVFGNRAVDDALAELRDTLEALEFCPVAAVEAVARHSLPAFLPYSAGRPDREDREQLAGFGRTIRDLVSAGGELSATEVPGHRPYKARGPVSGQPVGDDTCIRCGLCAASCPLKAIPAEAPNTTDPEACIKCMRCVSLCPVQCRKLSAAVASEALARMEPMFLDRKPNVLYGAR